MCVYVCACVRARVGMRAGVCVCMCLCGRGWVGVGGGGWGWVRVHAVAKALNLLGGGAYFSLGVLFFSEQVLFPNNLKFFLFFIYVTFYVSLCSYCCQRNFHTRTIRLYCIVLY